MQSLTWMRRYFTKNHGCDESRTYSAIAVANALIDETWKREQVITPMKIQRLIFFAHAWTLALTDKPLIDEDVVAWKFGPVVLSVYRSFRRWRATPILEFGVQTITEKDGSVSYHIPRHEDVFLQTLVEQIWDTYGHFTGSQLAYLAKKPSSP